MAMYLHNPCQPIRKYTVYGEFLENRKRFTYLHSNGYLTWNRFPVSSQGWLHERRREWSQTCQRLYRYMPLLPIYHVAPRKAIPRGRSKPLDVHGSIAVLATRVSFIVVPFCAPPPRHLSVLPFESSWIELQNTRKLEMYMRKRWRYSRQHADENSTFVQQKFNNSTKTQGRTAFGISIVVHKMTYM